MAQWKGADGNLRCDPKVLYLEASLKVGKGQYLVLRGSPPETNDNKSKTPTHSGNNPRPRFNTEIKTEKGVQCGAVVSRCVNHLNKMGEMDFKCEVGDKSQIYKPSGGNKKGAPEAWGDEELFERLVEKAKEATKGKTGDALTKAVAGLFDEKIERDDEDGFKVEALIVPKNDNPKQRAVIYPLRDVQQDVETSAEHVDFSSKKGFFVWAPVVDCDSTGKAKAHPTLKLWEVDVLEKFRSCKSFYEKAALIGKWNVDPDKYSKKVTKLFRDFDCHPNDDQFKQVKWN
jgi:hypothetical protein